MNTHLKRWLTGIIVVPTLVGMIVYAPPFAFSLIILFFVLIGVHEYNTMSFRDAHAIEKAEGFVWALMIMLAAFADAAYAEGTGTSGLVTMTATTVTVLFVTFLLFLFKIREKPTDLSTVMKVLFGFVYIPFTMAHFVLIRGFTDGVMWVIYIIVITFASDISAFYAGRTWGRKKLFPEVSEKKTAAGAIGSIVGTALASLLYGHFLMQGIFPLHFIALGLMAGILGQLGDLCASTVKRVSMVKDSGGMLPGHGGVLDRLDSFIFIVPFVYYYYTFVIR